LPLSAFVPGNLDFSYIIPLRLKDPLYITYELHVRARCRQYMTMQLPRGPKLQGNQHVSNETRNQIRATSANYQSAVTLAFAKLHRSCGEMLCQYGCMLKEPDTMFQLGAGARWSIMIISLAVTASSFLFINGVAFLIPSLEARRGIPLTEASLLSSMPSWGMVVTLVLWGYLLDRVGERTVMTAGSALTAAAAYAAASAHSMVWIGIYLFLGGMAAASCNSAGGRLVVGVS
jgi:hypothetical protein